MTASYLLLTIRYDLFRDIVPLNHDEFSILSDKLSAFIIMLFAEMSIHGVDYCNYSAMRKYGGDE